MSKIENGIRWVEVYYWDDDLQIVSTEAGNFKYSEVIPNEDYTYVALYTGD